MENKKRLGALDVFIILIIIVCIISIGFRVFANRSSEIRENVQLDNYIMSFKVMGIRETSASNYMKKGTKFYLREGKTLLGTISDNNITVTDAQRFYEALDGTIVSATNTGTGDLYKVDVEAAFDVKGKIDANGRFYLGGNKFVGVNQEIQIFSKYISITILITGITKA